jgi:hypothetical protein
MLSWPWPFLAGGAKFNRRIFGFFFFLCILLDILNTILAKNIPHSFHSVILDADPAPHPTLETWRKSRIGKNISDPDQDLTPAQKFQIRVGPDQGTQNWSPDQYRLVTA